MSDEWFYVQHKQRVGPVSIAELCRLAARSQLLPTDMVMNSGTRKWMPAREVKGLFPYASGPSQPPTIQAPATIPENPPAPTVPGSGPTSPIYFRCPACRADLAEPAERAGAFVPCRSCGVYVQVSVVPTVPRQ